MTILIISGPNDVHAYAMINALKRQGEDDVYLLDFSNFPVRMNLDMALSARDSSNYRLWLAQDKFIDRDAVRSIWWRGPQASGHQALSMNSEDQYVAMTETTTIFQSMWQETSCLWVNNIAHAAAITHKPWQLDLAKQCELTIPETLITTIPEHAQQFWQQHYGHIICQSLLQATHGRYEPHRLKWEEITRMDSMRLAQMLFQELVPGIADVRVTVIGDEILPAAIDLDQLGMRSNRRIYRRHDIPIDLQQKLLLLMRRTGLEYGVIDLRLKPDGEYVFFEINPAGHFLFVEHACQLPISDILAGHLARGKESKVVPISAQKAA